MLADYHHKVTPFFSSIKPDTAVSAAQKGCTDGLGWDRTNFPHSSLYGAVFWICDEDRSDNTRDVLFISEQLLHRVKTLSALQPIPPASRPWVHKKLGGDTAGTAHPN